MSERKRAQKGAWFYNFVTEFGANLGNLNSNFCSKEFLLISFNGYLNVRSSLWRFQIAPSEKRQQKKDPDEDQVCLLLGICKKDNFKMLCKSYC